jgi:hypothetical protein
MIVDMPAKKKKEKGLRCGGADEASVQLWCVTAD